MKRVVAAMLLGRDVAALFPQVVKNVASRSLDVKKLVYVYLAHYAERRPDEALLAVNTLQRDLGDANPLLRALSLRALAGIRVRTLLPLVVAAAARAARDASPFVRRCAAHAIAKVYSQEREAYTEQLIEIVEALLKDGTVAVVASAAFVFGAVCPGELRLLAPRFRALCRMLPDMEEWGQAVLADLLLRHTIGRHGAAGRGVAALAAVAPAAEAAAGAAAAPRAAPAAADSAESSGRDGHNGGFYSDSDSDESAEGGTGGVGRGRHFSRAPELDPDATGDESGDISLLLQSTTPLLWSRNAGVVLAAAVVHARLAGSRLELQRIAPPLAFLARSFPEAQQLVLANIATLAAAAPWLFAPLYQDFFVRASDPPPVRKFKLAVLAAVAEERHFPDIVRELQVYVRDPDRRFAAEAVRVLASCALRMPSVAARCVEGLVAVATSASHADGHTSGSPAAEAVAGIKALVYHRPQEHQHALVRLVRHLDAASAPPPPAEARAAIIGMLGEHVREGGTGVLAEMAPTVLRILAARFEHEDVAVKLQILNCAAKVLLKAAEQDANNLVPLVAYVLALAAREASADVRDRARLLCGLLASRLIVADADDVRAGTGLLENGDLPGPGTGAGVAISAEVARRFLLLPKAAPALPPLAPDRSAFQLGSMSHAVNHRAPGYQPLPEAGSFWSDASSGVGVEEGGGDEEEEGGERGEEVGEGAGAVGDAASALGSGTGAANACLLEESGALGGLARPSAAAASAAGQNPGLLIDLLDGDNSDAAGGFTLPGAVSQAALESWLGGREDEPSDSAL
eukprot:SM000035S13106  [mRNA]  locus=s35:475345:479539:- [translate_table: standard]